MNNKSNPKIKGRPLRKTEKIILIAMLLVGFIGVIVLLNVMADTTDTTNNFSLNEKTSSLQAETSYLDQETALSDRSVAIYTATSNDFDDYSNGLLTNSEIVSKLQNHKVEVTKIMEEHNNLIPPAKYQHTHDLVSQAYQKYITSLDLTIEAINTVNPDTMALATQYMEESNALTKQATRELNSLT